MHLKKYVHVFLACCMLARYTAERSHLPGEDLQQSKGQNLYAELNRDIRKLKTCSMQERHTIIEAWGPLVTTLIQALQKLPSKEGVLWRGVVEPVEKVQELFPAGHLVQMAGFTSTSTDARTATQMAGSGGTVLKVKGINPILLGPPFSCHLWQQWS